MPYNLGMLILIISDIHDNRPNLIKCLGWAKKAGVEKIICTGDVTNGDTLEFLANNFLGEIFLIRGNMDLYDENEVGHYLNIKYLGRYGITEVGNHKIGLCHEPFFIDSVRKLDQNLEIIFYGHTHKPWLNDVEGQLEVNPGTLSGTFQKATFATWETDNKKIELKVLELI
jgi:hypothetical protein